MPTEYNPQLVDNMSAKFRRLNNPAHAMADAVGMLQMFPGVRGIWTGAAVGGSGQMLDASGNGLHLTNNGNSKINRSGLAPSRNLNGSNQYYNRANEAAFDILGTEGFVFDNGLTIGAWAKFSNATPAALERWMGAFGNAGTTQLAYMLQRSTSGVPLFVVGDGSTSYTAGTTAIGAGVWKFLVGRYTPSTSIEMLINAEVDDTNTTSIPAALLNSSVDFTIGASPVPGNYMAGQISLAFLCTTAIPDIFIDTFYQMTAPLFGVSV